MIEIEDKATLREAIGIAVAEGSTGDKIAALGAAAAEVDRKTRAEDANGELASLLWRLAYGRDESARKRVILLFALKVRKVEKRRVWKVPRDDLIFRFATAVIGEWERKRVHGAKAIRNTATERAACLGVDLETYRFHWAKRFDWAHKMLPGVEAKISEPLRLQLFRGKVAP